MQASIAQSSSKNMITKQKWEWKNELSLIPNVLWIRHNLPQKRERLDDGYFR